MSDSNAGRWRPLSSVLPARPFEVECLTQPSGRAGFYALDCPHCGACLLRSLRGDVVEVRGDVRREPT
jgi:hypothetical protein